MKLKNWLTKHKLTQAYVADSIGLDRSRMCRIVKGEQLPTLHQVAAIYEYTDGEVAFWDWVEE
jgi:transcriptional regulator with XRE-family HTH domain